MSRDNTRFAPGARAIGRAILGIAAGMLLIVAGAVLGGHRAESRAQMRAAAGPNDAEHQSLAKLAGEYDRIVKFVGQQGAMAQPSSGTCTFSVELGGRFIVEKSHDVVFGRPVEGLRIYGYDDATKQYEMARMYTMSNGITLMKGTSSNGGKSIDFDGDTETGGGKTTPMRALFRQTDADHFSVTMATVGADGKNVPFQETDYTRKK
jgi:hypothetical protein